MRRDGYSTSHALALMATAFLHSGTIQIPAAYSSTSGVSWRTQSTATHRLLSSKSGPRCPSEHDAKKVQAVASIEVWWWRMKNRKVFRILKDAIRSAEYALTHDVIRKVCPSEAELLRDPTMKAKIKFRFGGDKFPPIILFKIFISGHTTGIKYLSGKKMIRPASNAARDVHRWMGSRQFYDQMLVDACQHQQLKITDEVDITTIKEYMQYAAAVDETPAYLGGKDNTWRKLNLDALPRHSVMYSVVELLEHSMVPGGGLSLEKLRSFTRPPTQVEQIQRIKTVSSLGASPVDLGGSGRSHGSRSSRLARQRARKMREMYGIKSSNTHPSQQETGGTPTPHTSPSVKRGGETRGEERGEEEGEDSDWERDASDLYQWTQNLSVEDVG